MVKHTQTYDAIILGAGGAGLMCAATAGQRGCRVLALDHADKAGKKILISGGGRCNFTNLATPSDRYLSQNRHFAKSALKRYPPRAFIKLVESYNIAWHEKSLGQLFCDDSAKQIVALLLSECEKGNVDLRLNHAIETIEHNDGRFHVATPDNDFSAPNLIIATGGPSIPKMGATGFAYDIAKQFGLSVVTPRPALVPLTLDKDEQAKWMIAGTATNIHAKCGAATFNEAALFTHRGLSGPAILQVSSYWQSGKSISVNFLPDAKQDWLIDIKKKQPKSKLKSVLSTQLPDRLAASIAAQLDCQTELANTSDKALRQIEHRLTNWTFDPSGTEGFAKAEVTAGGIDTVELSSQTMEAKNVPGLYVIGEAVDVTGWLGGYNFQWAWASGWAAGQAIKPQL